jgi:hypothetical protein
VVLGILDVDTSARGEVHDREAAPHSHQEQTLARRRNAADLFTDGKDDVFARAGVGGVNAVALDVDPEEPLAMRVPERTFAEDCVGIEEEVR